MRKGHISAAVYINPSVILLKVYWFVLYTTFRKVVLNSSQNDIVHKKFGIFKVNLLPQVCQ